jgi:hypothetical protein
LKQGQLTGIQNRSWRTEPSVSRQYHAVAYDRETHIWIQTRLTAAHINLSTPHWLLFAAYFYHCLHLDACIYVQLVLLDARNAVAKNFKAMRVVAVLVPPLQGQAIARLCRIDP